MTNARRAVPFGAPVFPCPVALSLWLHCLIYGDSGAAMMTIRGIAPAGSRPLGDRNDLNRPA